MNFTQRLKAGLWRAYGDPSSPAEWDGNAYGGGKLSQRFWEYHTALDLLDLSSDSVVLDIGGGSPVTGAGFFTRVIAPYVKEVHVMDVTVGESKETPSNIVFHRVLASYETLSKLLQENPHLTHVACISVFEHIPHEVRCGMVKAVNDAFSGDRFVATLEFHSNVSYFEHQLTTKTLSELFGCFTRFYPDVISKSPFWCENALRGVDERWRFLRRKKEKPTEIPLWYPVAFRFRRAEGE
jgi:hypothetical protein